MLVKHPKDRFELVEVRTFRDLVGLSVPVDELRAFEHREVLMIEGNLRSVSLRWTELAALWRSRSSYLRIRFHQFDQQPATLPVR